MHDQNFQNLLEENKQMIWRICCGYLKDEDLRKDLYQEICINIWKSLKSFEGRSSIRTWMYRIAVNTALFYAKAQQKKHSTDESIGNKDFVADPMVGDSSEQEQKLKLLYQCIHALPDVDRLVITMVLEKVSYKEIAETLGITVSNTGVKVTRIKKKLAKMMEASYGH